MKLIITSSSREILKMIRHLRMTTLASSLAGISALAAVSCAQKAPPCPCSFKPQDRRDPVPYADLRPLMTHWDPWHPETNREILKRPADFAIYSYPYAIASDKAYPREKKKAFIHFPEDEKWKELDCPHCHYNESDIGFGAKSWLRTKGGKRELVIAFRGTKFCEWQDWLYANLVPLFHAGSHNQYKAALFYAKSVVASHPGIPVVLTGHSLGGGLAEYCQRFIQNSESVTFDPSPNQGVLYALGRRETEKDAVRVYERGEILSIPRYIGSPDIKREKSPYGKGVRAIWVDFYNSNPISAHSMHDLAMSLVKVADLNGDAGAKSVHEQMKTDLREGRLQSGDQDPEESAGGTLQQPGMTGRPQAAHH
jgi:hypothetical protein